MGRTASTGRAIRARGLVKRYPQMPRPALDGLDLEVPSGCVLALLGANGAGKTTAVRLLTTLTRPDGGRAEVAGHDVVGEGAEVRRRIALVGQYAACDEALSATANLVLFGRLVGLARPAARARAAELLEQFGLTEHAHRPLSGFSGGMRRRIDLAAALVTPPEVLFVDEPTAGLDPEARRDLWAMIRTLVEAGTTVLLTTQYLEEADTLADDVVILRDGRVVASGTPAELKRLIGPPRMELREPTLEDVYLRVYGAVEAPDTARGTPAVTHSREQA